MSDKNNKSFSSITFLWILAFSVKELFTRTPLTLARLPILPDTFDADYLYNKFSHYWEKELKNLNKKGNQPQLWLALIRTQVLPLVLIICLGLVFITLECGLSYLLIWQIRALEESNFYATWQLINIAVLVAFCAVFVGFFSQTVEYCLHIVGMKYRILLTAAIYDKLQLMSCSQTQMLSFGKIVTIITSDLFKFDEVFNFIIYLIVSPIGIIVLVPLAYTQIGWLAIFILIRFVIHFLLQFSIGYVINQLYRKALRYSDIRNNRVREFIESIRLIKAFAWEYAVADSVERIRRQEILRILACYFFKAMANALSVSVPLLYILMVCLSSYAMGGGEFTSSRVFGFLALMYLYIRLFIDFNRAVVGVAELKVAILRVQRILVEYPNRNELQMETVGNVLNDQQVISVKQVTAGRMINETNKVEIILKEISFSVREGEILAVIGKVGSGKSSLLLTLLNEIEIIKGDCKLRGSIALVPQVSWILPTSLRENITYGRDWEEEWYRQVLAACCLETDMEQFPDGDLTVVGERGITLSGGQKARISLARAIYCNSDIYLLDDPFSAVDTVVARKLLSIFTTGLLANRTTILVTHHLQFLVYTDRVMILEEGRMAVLGNYFDVQSSQEYKRIIQQISPVEDESISLITQNKTIRINVRSALDLNSSYDLSRLHNERFPVTSPVASVNRTENVDKLQQGILSQLLVYARYLWYGGGVFGILALVVLCIISYFSLIVAKNYYLVWWIMADTDLTASNYSMTTHNYTSLQGFNPLTHLSLSTRIYIFAAFSLFVSVLLLLTNILFSWIPTIASYRLHNKMLWKVLRTPINFFDSNSTGSIINRFSKDIAIMDHLLPNLYIYSLDSMLIILFTLIAASIIHWLTLIISILLLIIAFLLRYQLVRVIRQIKHLEAESKNDVITHISLTLHGLSTIHSLGLASYQSNKMCTYQNIHSNTWRAYFGLIRSFAFQIDSLCSIYLFVVSMILIFTVDYLSPAVSAFVLSQISILVNIFQYSLRLTAEAEMNMVSVERVLEYTNLKEEPSLHRNIPLHDRFVVKRGEVSFSGVQLRYANGLPLALKGISFHVRAGERVAIIGRTGAGKSSISIALLRLVEIESGAIRIDGHDIRGLGLHELREQISIIPQDPVLFSGALRFALDPFSCFEEDQLWQTLGQVQLKEKVEGLQGQLQFLVSEGGSNFSVGERQLMCLARAILKRARIVVLDEATSNVDTLTDATIQILLRTSFSHCTVLTIAHRINTVMDYDRILVMESGKVVEFDTPINLLSQADSRFAYLAGMNNQLL